MAAASGQRPQAAVADRREDLEYGPAQEARGDQYSVATGGSRRIRVWPGAAVDEAQDVVSGRVKAGVDPERPGQRVSPWSRWRGAVPA
jgi:hypothetical protein